MTVEQFRKYRRDWARRKRRERGIKPRNPTPTPEQKREYHNEYMRRRRAGLIKPRPHKPPKGGWPKPFWKHGHILPGHNASPTYSTWAGMKQRCFNPNNRAYKNYGGRGITIDPSWTDFLNFLADMGEKPPGRSLERKNNNLGYCKANCCWATRYEQAYNRRNTKRSFQTLADLIPGLGEDVSVIAREIRKLPFGGARQTL